ncbi:MAG: extracellular solute-binding protein [Deltaproteobacteria bacterium]|nr:extracellular solute-binding protein [Deltaproteobacteria bacterium]
MPSPSKQMTLVFSLLLVVVVTCSNVALADWQTDWEQAKQAAAKEGEVVLYGPHLPFFGKIWEQFQKAYPGIKITSEPGRGSDHLKRVLAERRAGIYKVDLVMGGGNVLHGFPANALDPIPPVLLLPEVTRESAWFGKKLRLTDKEQKTILSFSESAKTSTIAYNTKSVNPKEIQAWKDLLNPKWKGKIAGFDPRVSGGGDPFRFFQATPEFGPEFVSRLVRETEIVFTRDLHQGLDWLASGKYELYLGSALFTLEAKEKGLPVDILPQSMKDGETMGLGGVCCVALINRAPHPKATKVFLNWLLSREGQTLWQRLSKTNSLRIDIPKTDVHPAFVPKDGVKYFMATSYQYQDPELGKALDRVVDDALAARK